VNLTATTAVLRRGLDEGAFSAVSAEIGRLTGPLWTFAQGRLGLNHATAVDGSTIFDLASLTKVIATTAVALRLVQQERLHIDMPASPLLPQWQVPGRHIPTVRDLLEHCSGLPGYREYFRELSGIDAYLAAIAEEPLEYEPRTRAVYSDLGFIVLGAVLERLAGTGLERQFKTWKSEAGIEEPLTYLPPADWKPRTALTEFDLWRGRQLQGEVHDENAAALGGVAAHAGLFGTASAVGSAARWWMLQLQHHVGQQFAQRSSVPGSSRALGWDTMLPTSSCGRLLSPGSIGHTGFTGTTLWIDHTRGLYFVLLTNRVHITRASDVIQQLRREFHEAAIEDLT
jgi:CubicO group peptidase (beta-lactamase class C family)